MTPFDQSVGSSPTMIGKPKGPPVDTLGAGAVLGNYRIVRFLGAGGMGAVYVADHIHLKSRHALKTIRPELARRAGFEERFLREARLTSRLKHPHIVPCTDAGVAEGVPYLVMDFIEGPNGEPMNLRQLMDDRKAGGKELGEDEAAAVGLEICRALEYAHNYHDAEIPSGLIHRDLKPGNILLDKDTRLYITDFGLARLIGAPTEGEVEQDLALSRSVGELATRAGEVSTSSDAVGTFDYMSPEQREGRVADARSDMYAMGAILYELLTGRKVVGMVKKPSKVRPGLDPVWDKIILERCLAYDPALRYPSAGDLCRAIEQRHVGAGEKTAPVPPPLKLAAVPAPPLPAPPLPAPAATVVVPAPAAPPKPAAPRKKTALWIAGGALAGVVLAGGLAWWIISNLEGNPFTLFTDKDKPGTSSVTAPAPKGPELSAAENMQRYNAAMQAREKLATVGRGHGFGEKLDQVDLLWRAGETARHAQDWPEALRNYDKVLMESQRLQDLDSQRKQALAGAQQATVAKQTAANAGAAELAAEAWTQLTQQLREADRLLEQGLFGEADRAYQVVSRSASTAEQLAGQHKVYRQAKTDYETALARANVSQLNEYGGETWESVRLQALQGANRSADPVSGLTYYQQALNRLPAAIAAAEAAQRAGTRMPVQYVAEPQPSAPTPVSRMVCPTCRGAKTTDSSSGQTCNVCQGKGVYTSQLKGSQSRGVGACPFCRGSGRVTTRTSCYTCGGSGTIMR